MTLGAIGGVLKGSPQSHSIFSWEADTTPSTSKTSKIEPLVMVNNILVVKNILYEVVYVINKNRHPHLLLK